VVDNLARVGAAVSLEVGGFDPILQHATHATAVLYNGLGRHDAVNNIDQR
jgi:hypothetical protein